MTFWVTSHLIEQTSPDNPIKSLSVRHMPIFLLKYYLCQRSTPFVIITYFQVVFWVNWKINFLDVSVCVKCIKNFGWNLKKFSVFQFCRLSIRIFRVATFQNWGRVTFLRILWFLRPRIQTGRPHVFKNLIMCSQMNITRPLNSEKSMSLFFWWKCRFWWKLVPDHFFIYKRDT